MSVFRHVSESCKVPVMLWKCFTSRRFYVLHPTLSTILLVMTVVYFKEESTGQWIIMDLDGTYLSKSYDVMSNDQGPRNRSSSGESVPEYRYGIRCAITFVTVVPRLFVDPFGIAHSIYCTGSMRLSPSCDISAKLRLLFLANLGEMETRSD